MVESPWANVQDDVGDSDGIMSPIDSVYQTPQVDLRMAAVMLGGVGAGGTLLSTSSSQGHSGELLAHVTDMPRTTFNAVE